MTGEGQLGRDERQVWDRAFGHEWKKANDKAAAESAAWRAVEKARKIVLDAAPEGMVKAPS